MEDKQNYILISFASKNRKYLQYAHSFKKNLKKIKVKYYDITYMDVPTNLNYWQDQFPNQQIQKALISLQKPTLILNKLNQYQMPIICVDIDSKLNKKPILPTQYFDNSFIFRKNRRRLAVTNGFHVHNFTDKSIRFLKLWEYLCKFPELTYFSDHHRLKIAIDLVKQENRNRIMNSNTIILNSFDLYKDVYIEGLTRLNKTVRYIKIKDDMIKIRKNFQNKKIKKISPKTLIPQKSRNKIKKQLKKRKRESNKIMKIKKISPKTLIPQKSRNEIKKSFMVKGRNHILINKYKLIFTLIPKNACTSGKYILLKDFFPDFFNSININNTDKMHRDTNKIFNYVNYEYVYKNSNHLRITIVRNPFDRLVSGWKNKIKNLDLTNFKRSRRYGFTNACSFKQFIQQIYDTPEERIDRHFIPQYRFITYNDTIFSDRILKFENLTQEWDNLIKEIYERNKIEMSKLTVNLNNTKSDIGYRKYYDNELIKLVEKKFEKDLNTFNYMF